MEILFGRAVLPVLVAYFVCGALWGGLYDLVCIKRELLYSPGCIRFFEDILFMLAGGVLVLLCAYAYNNGCFRWYELPTMLSGLCLYRVTLSRVLMGLCIKGIRYVKKKIERSLSPLWRILQRGKGLLCRKSVFVIFWLYTRFCQRKLSRWI